MAGQGQLAREVRAGLTVINGGSVDSKPVGRLDQLSFKKPIRKHVLEFAAIFGVIFNLIALFQLYKGNPISTPLALSISSVILNLVGRFAPIVLLPAWEAWMKFAHVLGMVMTTVILGIAWIIALIPIAMLLKLLRVKVMDASFKKPVSTYWEDRPEKFNDFKLLERQF